MIYPSSLFLCNTGFVHLEFEVGQWLGQIYLWALWFVFCMVRFFSRECPAIPAKISRTLFVLSCSGIKSWIGCGRSVIISCDLPSVAPYLKLGHLLNKPVICSLSVFWRNQVTFNIAWIEVGFLTGYQEILMKFCMIKSKWYCSLLDG